MEIDVGNMTIQFKLDTGSQVNIIPLHLDNTIGEVRLLKEPHEKVAAYNGSKIITIGYCSLPCKYDDKIRMINCYIVNTRSPPILRSQTCIDFELIKLVYSLDKETSPR